VETWQPLSVFEFTIAVAIIVAAPMVFWFFYSIIALRLGWERGKHDYLHGTERDHRASAGDDRPSRALGAGAELSFQK